MNHYRYPRKHFPFRFFILFIQRNYYRDHNNCPILIIIQIQCHDQHFFEFIGEESSNLNLRKVQNVPMLPDRHRHRHYLLPVEQDNADDYELDVGLERRMVVGRVHLHVEKKRQKKNMTWKIRHIIENSESTEDNIVWKLIFVLYENSLLQI